MDRNQQETMLLEAQAELTHAREELSAIERRVTSLQQVVEGLSGLLQVTNEDIHGDNSRLQQWHDVERERLTPGIHSPSAPPLGGGGRIRVRPRDAVLEVLAMRPGLAMAPKDVVDLVRAMGLYDPGLKSGSNGYTTALLRLAEDDTSGVERDSEGQYVYRARRGSISAGRILGPRNVRGGSLTL